MAELRCANRHCVSRQPAGPSPLPAAQPFTPPGQSAPPEQRTEPTLLGSWDPDPDNPLSQPPAIICSDCAARVQQQDSAAAADIVAQGVARNGAPGPVAWPAKGGPRDV